jgi:hypothetical protein
MPQRIRAILHHIRVQRNLMETIGECKTTHRHLQCREQ